MKTGNFSFKILGLVFLALEMSPFSSTKQRRAKSLMPSCYSLKLQQYRQQTDHFNITNFKITNVCK